jgi:hypothetical protein
MANEGVIFHKIQALLNFIAMVCFAKVADFEAKWRIGPCEHFQESPEKGSAHLADFPSSPIAPLSALGVVSSVLGVVLSLYCLFADPTIPLSPLQYFIVYRHGLIFTALMSCIHGAIG